MIKTQERKGENTMKAYRVTYRAFSIDGFDCWEAERGLYLRKETAEKVEEKVEEAAEETTEKVEEAAGTVEEAVEEATAEG